MQPEKGLVDNTGLPPEKLFLESLTFVKQAFVKSLRTAFSQEDVPERYRYHKDMAKRQVSIYRSWPERQVKFPLILVLATEVETPITSLGNELANQYVDLNSGDVEADYFNGTMWIPVTLEIAAQKVRDRDRITELTAIYVRHLFLPFFKKVNLEYVGVSIEAPDEPEQINGDDYFVGRVKVRCQTEYHHRISLEMFAAMRGVVLNLRYGVGGENPPNATDGED